MTSVTMKPDSSQPAAETAVHLFDNWFNPIETGVRERVRDFIEELIHGELDTALARRAMGEGRRPLMEPTVAPAWLATGTGTGRAR